MDQFCIQCGTPLGPTGVCPKCRFAAQPAPAPVVQVSQQPAPQPPQKKKNKTILILIAILGAAAFGIGLFSIGKAAGLFGGSDNRPGGRPGGDPGDVPEITVTRPAAEDYLAGYGDITHRKPVKSADLLTEAEAVREFAARGFEGVTVTACYDTDGTYTDNREVSADGKEKHPYYSAYYLTPEECLWTLFLMGDVFYAEPISFNAVQRHDGPIVLSETGKYVTYDGKENAFLTLEPKDDNLILKRVDRIDAATLDELDAWEVADL